MDFNMTATTVGPHKDGSFRAAVKVTMNSNPSMLYVREGYFDTEEEAVQIAEGFLQYAAEVLQEALVEVRYERLPLYQVTR